MVQPSFRALVAILASFVLIHNVTLLKDFDNSILINFFPIHTHTHTPDIFPSLFPFCFTPPPFSSGSVDHTDDGIDYGTTVSEPRAEESDEGRERRYKTKQDG